MLVVIFLGFMVWTAGSIGEGGFSYGQVSFVDFRYGLVGCTFYLFGSCYVSVW